ncbi:MAG: ABC transporter substrate-binding protein [Chloroflexota bacterium]|nr:ABC transporter substrate-binding protein [Chloroflexota bacterium]
MHSFDSNNSPFGRLVAESLTGQLSRREIMRRGAALGVGASVLSMLIAAGSRRGLAQEATPAGQEAGWSITVPEGLRTDLDGARVNFVSVAASSADRPWLDAALAVFNETTGAAAAYVPGEQSATDRLAIYNQQLGAQSPDNDVYEIDVIWPGILAVHATDLLPALSELAALHFPAIVENNTINGALIGMPFFTDAGLLYYRTDLLDKYGFEAGPATWAEMEEQAQAIMDGERSENPDFQGFVWQGNAYEGLTCNGLEWQYSQGGGRIIEPDGTVTINNPQAIAAFERAASWVNGISPEGVTTYAEPESLNVFAPGNAAFMRNWPYAWAVTQDEAAGSPLVGMVGVSPLPMGDGEGAQNAATLGGWQLMVSRYSPNQDAAIEFVKFMCSPEIQTSRAVERSLLPTIGSVYDDPQVAEASEFIPRLREVFEGGAVARPSSPSGEFYNSVSIAYFTQLNQVLTAQAEAGAAVEAIEAELVDIMDQLG